MALLTPEQLSELAAYERSSSDFCSIFGRYTPEERYIGLLLVTGKEKEAKQALQDLAIEGDVVSKETALRNLCYLLPLKGNLVNFFTKLFTAKSLEEDSRNQVFSLIRSFNDIFTEKAATEVNKLKEEEKRNEA